MMEECFACGSEEPTVAVLPRAELNHGKGLCASCADVRDAIDFEAAERKAGKIGKELRQSKREEFGDDE